MAGQITNETKAAILDAAWALVLERGAVDISQADLARAAGVSRQTVYLAFGGRAGMLTAMLHHRDAKASQVGELYRIGHAETSGVADLMRYTEVWLDYLPEIYAVGIVLDAASVTDPDAKQAWDDRMVHALLAGFRSILQRLNEQGDLRAGADWKRIAETAWSFVHPTAWRLLVVEAGWDADAFRRDRLDRVRQLVVGPRSGASDARSGRRR